MTTTRPWTELGFSVDELPYSMQFKYVSDGRALQLAVQSLFDAQPAGSPTKPSTQALPVISLAVHRPVWPNGQ